MFEKFLSGQVSPIKILRQTVTSQLIEVFKARIMEGEWRLGEQIPTEVELSRIFGVGRSTVRESLQHLVAIGLLERNKRQIFVSNHVSEMIAEPLNMLMEMQRISAKELFETRLVLQVAMAGLAALRRSQRHIRMLSIILDEMEHAKTNEFYIDNMLKFHTEVANASKNQLLIKLFEGIREPLNAQQQVIITQNNARSQTLYEHREILNAIEIGNKILAEVKMRNHLNKGMKNIS